jgi:hypothetical protein
MLIDAAVREVAGQVHARLVAARDAHYDDLSAEAFALQGSDDEGATARAVTALLLDPDRAPPHVATYLQRRWGVRRADLRAR